MVVAATTTRDRDRALAPLGRRKIVAALATPPNAVTLSRLALIGAAFGAASVGAARLALALGAAAGASDHVDGWLARRSGRVTRLGEILDQFVDTVGELSCLLYAVAAGTLPLLAVVPWALRELWVASVRRSSIELGRNIPSHWTGKLKTAFIGWSVLPLFAGVAGIHLGGVRSAHLVTLGLTGIVIGIGLAVASGLVYTAEWLRIYEERGPAAD
jgi:phosphatidylglycerophosphate synthase